MHACLSTVRHAWQNLFTVGFALVPGVPNAAHVHFSKTRPDFRFASIPDGFGDVMSCR